MTGWLVLLAGLALEVLGTLLLRGIRGVPVVLTFITAALCMLASLALFAVAIRYIPLSVAYTAWAGIGTAAVVIVSALAYHETITTVRLFSILFVVIGVIGLNLPATADPRRSAQGSSPVVPLEDPLGDRGR